MTTVGLISPGEMGASIGAAAGVNARVIWAGQDRSEVSHERAEKAGLKDCGNIATLCRQADIILSICPPHDAAAVAAFVAEQNFAGLFADCNAISPANCLAIAEDFEGSLFVDGGIIGGPAWKAESGTQLYLSGFASESIAALFKNSPLHTTVISAEVGAASALKMAFAAYTKGSIALLAGILGMADHYGVRQNLEQQWGETFASQTHERLIGSSAKFWRFSGEMREIANTFDSAGMPDGFHLAAAEIYSRLGGFKDNPADSINDLLAELAQETEKNIG